MRTIVSCVTTIQPLLGKIELVVSHKSSVSSGIDTNIELNKFITWNLVSRLASLKLNLLHIGGESFGEVQSRFLHWSYLSQRSFTTRQLVKSKLYQLCHRQSYPNEIKADSDSKYLRSNSQFLVKCNQGNQPSLVFLELENFVLDLSLIPAQPKFGIINVLIEIPAGSKNKYEFDKDLNAIALDRVLSSSVQYPYDYGFIPNTLGNDGDPLDGMVIIDQPTFPGCVIAARPIGMLEMIDGGDRDEKILCVADKDPRYAHVKSLKDIPQHRLDEISEFFKTYKNLEKKVTEILGWKDVDAVMPLVQECVAAAKK